MAGGAAVTVHGTSAVGRRRHAAESSRHRPRRRRHRVGPHRQRAVRRAEVGERHEHHGAVREGRSARHGRSDRRRRHVPAARQGGGARRRRQRRRRRRRVAQCGRRVTHQRRGRWGSRPAARGGHVHRLGAAVGRKARSGARRAPRVRGGGVGHEAPGMDGRHTGRPPAHHVRRANEVRHDNGKRGRGAATTEHR